MAKKSKTEKPDGSDMGRGLEAPGPGWSDKEWREYQRTGRVNGQKV